MKIDWKDKVTVAQVDTRGKGYAPAARPSPPRSAEVAGFFRESREVVLRTNPVIREVMSRSLVFHVFFRDESGSRGHGE